MRHILPAASLAALLLAGCASNPPDQRPPAPTLHGCVVETPGYPPCEWVPELYSQPYYYPYPTFVEPYPWYPGTVVVIPAPYPVPVPTPVPPVKPPKPKPPQPQPPPHARRLPPPCRPTRNHPCP